MTNLKKYSIFHDFCIICANFCCEEESFHQKITFFNVQAILNQWAFMEVSIQIIQKQSKIQRNNTSIHQNNINLIQKNKKINKIIQNGFNLQKLIKQLSECLYSRGQRNYNKLESGKTHICSILGAIFCMQIIYKNPLIYHDLTQIIRLIGLYKWKQNNKQQQIIQLPFTRPRIIKVINFLKKGLEKNKFIYNKAIQLNHNKQNILPLKNNISILNSNNNTQIFQKYNIIDKSQYQNLKITKNFTNQKQRQIIRQVLNEQTTCKIIVNSMKQILNFYPFINIQEFTKYLFCFIFQEIHLLKSKIIQKFNIKKLQKNFAIINQVQKTKNIKFYENPQILELLYIQGIPFPSNRQFIDFSLLQIDDKLLFNYLPSLQKFKDLEQISLRTNKLTSRGYKILKNLFPNLKSLDIRQNTLDRQIIQIITSLKNLNSLYISDCRVHSASLVKICLNLPNLNILYSDNIILMEKENQQNQILDYRGIFYIMCLNLKKLLYLSLKGYFSNKFKNMITPQCHFIFDQRVKLEQHQINQISLIRNISQTLRKRHGILEI